MKREIMTIRDIAGFCPEVAVWKMMADISEYILHEDTMYELSPDAITIDGDAFMVDTGHVSSDEFMAPERHNGKSLNSAQMVWSLGAIAYFTATGHVIFGGHGGYYQKEHPAVALPTLTKDKQSLTSVVQHCLNYNPDERISLKELNEQSLKELAACKKRPRTQLAVSIKKNNSVKDNHGERWPEEMIEV